MQGLPGGERLGGMLACQSVVPPTSPLLYAGWCKRLKMVLLHTVCVVHATVHAMVHANPRHGASGVPLPHVQGPVTIPRPGAEHRNAGVGQYLDFVRPSRLHAHVHAHVHVRPMECGCIVPYVQMSQRTRFDGRS